MKYESEVLEGVVEYFGQNRFDKNQFCLRLEGSDTWLYQKANSNNVYPRKGERVTLVRVGRFFQNLKAEYSHGEL